MTDTAGAATRTAATFRFLDAFAATRADARGTGGQLGITEFWAAEGHGSPMMVHAKEDEGYFVIDGEIEWRAGDDPPARYGAGALAWAPRGVAHAYIVSSPSARFLCLTTPAGLEGFFRELGQPAETDELPVAGSASEEDAGRAIVTVAEYGVTVIGPPAGL
ncbi:MAG: hypothetical protein QOH17_1175 [Pseudonocardiales bacterium]|jgi:quercetin dioxygenase-like cupin family protein|nr:hypothetical protein [Pseudonocardiales bacterium]